jgi:tetratricopeptide (TPR) repeat protein
VSLLDERDRADPLIRRAGEKAEQGDVEDAIRLYVRALESNPLAARGHLDLALVLHDQAEDYVTAIYHYRRYLDLRPKTQKKAMIEERIRVAKQLVVGAFFRELQHRGRTRSKVGREARNILRRVGNLDLSGEPGPRPDEPEGGTPGPVPDDGAGDADGPEGADVQAKVEYLVRENEALRRRIQELVAAAQATSRRPSVAATRTSAGPLAGTGTGGSGVVRTYRVQRGDTLSSIAADVYKDATQWRRIYEANRDSLKESSQLRVGQLLVIP